MSPECYSGQWFHLARQVRTARQFGMDPTKVPTEEENAAYDGSEADSLGLDGLIGPNDDGISLDELSQADVALLSKGSDPYLTEKEASDAPQLPDEIAEVIEESENQRQQPPPDVDVTPRSILEAMLFVGHPTGEPLTSERIASFMRGVRPAEIDELVREMNAEYDESVSYWIVSDGPGYRMEIRAEFASLREAFYGRIRERDCRRPPSMFWPLWVTTSQWHWKKSIASAGKAAVQSWLNSFAEISCNAAAQGPVRAGSLRHNTAFSLSCLAWKTLANYRAAGILNASIFDNYLRHKHLAFIRAAHQAALTRKTRVVTMGNAEHWLLIDVFASLPSA